MSVRMNITKVVNQGQNTSTVLWQKLKVSRRRSQLIFLMNKKFSYKKWREEISIDHLKDLPTLWTFTLIISLNVQLLS